MRRNVVLVKYVDAASPADQWNKEYADRKLEEGCTIAKIVNSVVSTSLEAALNTLPLPSVEHSHQQPCAVFCYLPTINLLARTVEDTNPSLAALI
eukprot:6482253-Amphidinium_carterae.1